MGEEIEVKFALENGFEPVRERLRAAGGVLLGRVFERNRVFDLPDGRLFSRGELLRLRQAEGGVLTWKSAPLPDPNGFKRCREVETGVADPAAMRVILAELGYVPALAYEKLRETWELDGCHICLDELPFGRFVEIEGPPETIGAVSARLGFIPDRRLAKNYHQLNQESRAARGLPPSRDFVFSPEEAARLERLAASG